MEAEVLSINDYRDLTVWKKAMDLVERVYKSTANLPRSETYGLMGQMRRAAVSVASNIAEGNAHGSTREYIHHPSFAHGSVAELDTQLQICRRLGYLDDSETEPDLKSCQEVGKMLLVLQRSLRKNENMAREEDERDFYGSDAE